MLKKQCHDIISRNRVYYINFKNLLKFKDITTCKCNFRIKMGNIYHKLLFKNIPAIQNILSEYPDNFHIPLSFYKELHIYNKSFFLDSKLNAYIRKQVLKDLNFIRQNIRKIIFYDKYAYEIISNPELMTQYSNFLNSNLKLADCIRFNSCKIKNLNKKGIYSNFNKFERELKNQILDYGFKSKEAILSNFKIIIKGDKITLKSHIFPQTIRILGIDDSDHSSLSKSLKYIYKFNARVILLYKELDTFKLNLINETNCEKYFQYLESQKSKFTINYEEKTIYTNKNGFKRCDVYNSVVFNKFFKQFNDQVKLRSTESNFQIFFAKLNTAKKMLKYIKIFEKLENCSSDIYSINFNFFRIFNLLRKSTYIAKNKTCINCVEKSKKNFIINNESEFSLFENSYQYLDIIEFSDQLIKAIRYNRHEENILCLLPRESILLFLESFLQNFRYYDTSLDFKDINLFNKTNVESLNINCDKIFSAIKDRNLNNKASKIAIISLISQNKDFFYHSVFHKLDSKCNGLLRQNYITYHKIFHHISDFESITLNRNSKCYLGNYSFFDYIFNPDIIN